MLVQLVKKQWKIIEEFEDYKVSNFGDIYSIRSGKLLKLLLNPSGYLIVVLCKEGKCTSKTVHRLVAKAFIPNLDNLPIVDHINKDKKDNKISNLRWSSVSTNRRNSSDCSTAVSKFNCVYRNKNSWMVVIRINNISKYIGNFKTEIDAAKAFNQFCIKNNLDRELNNITEA